MVNTVLPAGGPLVVTHSENPAASTTSPVFNPGNLAQSPVNQSTKLNQIGASAAKAKKLHDQFQASRAKTVTHFNAMGLEIQEAAKKSEVEITEIDRSSGDAMLHSLKAQVAQIEKQAATKGSDSANDEKMSALKKGLAEAETMLENCKDLKRQLVSTESHIQALKSAQESPPNVVNQSPNLTSSNDQDRQNTYNTRSGNAGDLAHASHPVSHPVSPNHDYAHQSLAPAPHNASAGGDTMQQQMAFQKHMTQQQQELTNLNQQTAMANQQIKAMEAQFMAMIDSLQAGLKEQIEINKKGNQIATEAI